MSHLITMMVTALQGGIKSQSMFPKILECVQSDTVVDKLDPSGGKHLQLLTLKHQGPTKG